jgi:hypothetical protein
VSTDLPPRVVRGDWFWPPVCRVVADRVEAEFGRQVVGVLLVHNEVRRVALQTGRLRTAGPVLFRTVRLVDRLPPHRPMAVCWSLVVPERLPPPVRDALASGEPLDRLLARHGVPWRCDLLPEEGFVGPHREASSDFSWLEPAGSFVQMVRLLTIDRAPVAMLIDEVPLRPDRPAATG